MSVFYIDLTKDLSDRFDMEKFLDFKNQAHDPLTSFFIEKIKKLPVRGSFTVTSEVARPDLISYKIFRDTQYWWLLMEFNKISKRSDITIGTEINFFSIDELEEIYYTLKANQNKYNKEIAVNTQPIIIIPPTIGTNNNPSNNSSDLNRVYDFFDTDIIIINHDMNKRPVPLVVVYDIDGNEVNEEAFWLYPVGLETKRIIISLTGIKSGKVVLN